MINSDRSQNGNARVAGRDVHMTSLEQLAKRLDIHPGALARIMRVISDQNSPTAELDRRLYEVFLQQNKLVDRLGASSSDDPEVQRLRSNAARAVELGDFDLADTLLMEAQDVDVRAVEGQSEARDRRLLSRAETLARRGVLARARLKYPAAASYFAQSAALVPESALAKRWDYLIEQASALYALGNEFGDNAGLLQAVDVYRVALDERPRTKTPLDWAMTQTNLGDALRTLGERESGTARLEEAVAAYRAALEEFTRERVPLEWATTQTNLGTALWTLGERESGTARLEEAVAAYRAALEEFTRDSAPLDWARTQTNLGNALRTLGERESGTARLEEAVAAYRAALEELTREHVPLDWATTQNNLGNALQTLGERESGTARLEEAVAAYRAALEERTRERVPLQWAVTQTNLGTALSDARGAGERDGASGGGGRGLSRRAGGMDARARAARLGEDAEQSRHLRSPRSGSGRAGRRVWRRRSWPIAPRWRR